MKLRALLIGINAYPGNALNGCINDIDDWQSDLINYFGFNINDVNTSSEMRVLKDRDATTANIKAGLAWLVAGLEPGDIAVCFYSGHGALVPCRDGNSLDGYDEVLCPIDFTWNGNYVSNDDFAKIFANIPQDAMLLCVFDCCHSGSALDVQGYAPKNNKDLILETPILPKDAILKCIPTPPELIQQVEAARREKLNYLMRAVVVGGEFEDQKGILLSGCGDGQTSADALINGRFNGAATYYLREVLTKHNYAITYEDLMNETCVAIKKAGYAQIPELNCSTGLEKLPFLGGPIAK